MTPFPPGHGLPTMPPPVFVLHPSMPPPGALWLLIHLHCGLFLLKTLRVRLPLPPPWHTTTHGIDIEGEERLYAELMKDYNELDGQVSQTRNTFIMIKRRTDLYRLSNTPHCPSLPGRTVTDRLFKISRWTLSHSEHQFLGKHMRHSLLFACNLPKPNLYFLQKYFWWTSGGSSSTPPLFVQGVKIDGWFIQ